MNVPDWYSLILLSLAAFRVWRLLAIDDILDAPRRYLLRLGNWREEGDPVPASYRKKVGSFLTCWWCAGFWIGLAWWCAWIEWPHGTLVAAVPFAISVILAAAAKILSD